MTEQHDTHEGCDAADLPQASMLDHPADHLLEAYCPKCDHAVEAVCPKCRSHVEPGGAPGTAGPTEPNGSQGTASPTISALTPQEFYRRFATMLQSSRNSKFTLGCYLIATGDAYADGVSMREFGEAWGVGRAAVSKHCRRICALLQIDPSRYMRKEETAAKFKASNRRPMKLENPKAKI